MISIKKISPHHPDVQELIEALDAYQAALYPPESNHLDPADELARDNVLFIGVFVDEVLAGCGAVKVMGETYGEIKRVYVRPEFRGQGLAKHIMDRLEQHLIDHDIPLARLETGIRQPEALRLYQRRGYTACGPFGDYVEDPLSLFMEKRLASAAVH